MVAENSKPESTFWQDSIGSISHFKVDGEVDLIHVSVGEYHMEKDPVWLVEVKFHDVPPNDESYVALNSSEVIALQGLLEAARHEAELRNSKS